MLGGLLIPNNFAKESGEDIFTDERQWWYGVCLVLALAITLKLTACTIQQKLIGEQLSKNQGVLELVGVHKPFMQVIKKLLEPKQLTLPKIAILAGGPDWPTSVMAGILKIELVPCLIGTLPCFMIASSCVLTGAFMSRREAFYNTSLSSIALSSAIFFNVT